MSVSDKNLIKSYFIGPYDIKEIILYIDEIDSVFEF
jgi:hypothetical protein